MSFNIVDIQVVTDYTDFSNTVRFHLNVPVTADDAETIVKDLASEKWDTVSSDLTTATANAPKPIQDLVAKLIEAYSGKAASEGGSAGDAKDPPKDPQQTPDGGQDGGDPQ